MVRRCLVLHCLRMMIMEQQWDDIQAMGSAIINEVVDHISVYLAHIRAEGVSPLRVLTAWLGSRGNDAPRIARWYFGELLKASMTPQVFKAHPPDIAPFLRRMVRLGYKDWLLNQLLQSSVLREIMGSVLDDYLKDDGSDGQPPRKRAKVQL
ncbi:unnamed protein product [Vitrella brassicaformis CCMP3155]|uniref:Uncharacterized protein n=1 Tax=Vitrella brassicaformis (strain CCMP3155) TaxID=1169540 RepID=A0A0G4FHF9_VITBC|nr:unnamed protein product [Vitrella brassicaformis CCMP3155]|eukprot:CEM12733.1 unnamed protein product [Vitrella brassicaformis CCMP3155]